MILAEAKVKRKRMSKEEKEQWDELYSYVKELMGYDDKTSLSRTEVLKLKGLTRGQFIANNNQQELAEYSFYEILVTFKVCKFDIIRGFRSNSFKSNGHKFNYMIKIVEGNLSTIRERLKNRERQEERIEQIEVNTGEEIAEYKKKSKEVKNKRLKGLI